VPLLKICGVRQPDQAMAIAALGVDAVGVIGVPGSPRFVAPEHRSELFRAVVGARPQCRSVLVVADPDETDLEVIMAGPRPKVLQLHGHESPQRCGEIRRRFDGEVWKALRIRSAGDLEGLEPWAGVVDALLLDAWAPGRLGGTGRRIPTEWLRDLHCPAPWWLAGGVTPELVASLLAELQPHGLDVSSGVERSPGVKDLEKVERLLQAVRSREEPPAASPVRRTPA
jgi:phosphoribosylanthranilate isomerase